MAGEIFDIAVDLRRSSPTFGKWVGVTLTVGGHRMLWIPEGFAHGPSAARRPTYSVLDNRRAAHALATSLPDWRSLVHREAKA